MRNVKKEKSEIKVGDQVYGIPSDNSNPFAGGLGIPDPNGEKKPSMGTVIGYDEVTKKYAK